MAFKLESDWPRLTETLPHPHPDVCNSCMATDDLQLWQEHDRFDKPEPKWVLLCQKCADKIIEPHPRLYNKVCSNSPAPGAMLLCTFCVHRTRTSCSQTLSSGGPGITITSCKPMVAHIDGRNKNGRFALWLKSYAVRPTACSRHEIKKPKDT